jgi:FkbM family methyltransferase
MRSYSQNCEDLIIQILLPSQEGFYVDVGANHPHGDSVTKLFYLKGWRGINIEPIPSLYQQLVEARPRDINLNIGIAGQPGKLELREYGDGLQGWSTFSTVLKEHVGAEQAHVDYWVAVEPLRAILAEHKVTHIDFLKVDVEGLEYEVLASNDWERFRPKVVIVENTSIGEWIDVLKLNGYTEVFFDGLNRYFVSEPGLAPGLFLKEFSNQYCDGETQALTEEMQKAQQDHLATQKRSDNEIQTLTAEMRKVQQDYLAIRERPENYIGIRNLTKALGKRLLHRSYRSIMAVKG